MENNAYSMKDMNGLLETIKKSNEIPYIVYEAEMVRQEKKQRRLIFVILALIGAILIMNLAWIYAWMQYDYYGYEATSDRGNANIIGNDGDINNYGNSETSEED